MNSFLGRVLAIDYGTKRLGLAITDPDRTIVFPREVVQNQGENFLLDFFEKYCVENRVTLVLVGVPYHEDRRENPMTLVTRDFIGKLSERFDGQNLEIPVEPRDESFTSGESRMILDELGMTPGEQKEHKDVLSAIIILRGYLDSL